MKNSLIIILYDHPFNHTADYCTQTSKYLHDEYFVLNVLLKDTFTIKEFFTKQRSNTPIIRYEYRKIIITPILLMPFKRFKIVQKINQYIVSCSIYILVEIIRLLFKLDKAILWSFNPLEYVGFSQRWDRSVKICDCVDFHEEMQHASSQYSIALKAYDYVTVNSTSLYRLLKNYRHDIIKVPVGFDLDTLENSQKHPIEVPWKSKYSIGYIGGINSRIDFRLLRSVVRMNPSVDFVFIGQIQQRESCDVFKDSVLNQIQSLFAMKNVYHIPLIPREDIGSFVIRFTACMIPYDAKLLFNKYSFPMKLFEYIYFHKPILSTPIDELAYYDDFVHIGATASEWNDHVKKILKTKSPQYSMYTAAQILKESTWKEKIDRILVYSGI